MEESNQKRIEELFQRCVSLPPNEWKRFLETHCEDADVRAAVHDLLRRDAGKGYRTRRFASSWAQHSDPGSTATEGNEINGAAAPDDSDAGAEAALDDSAAIASRPSSSGVETDPPVVDECDVLICYAALDDEPVSAGKEGWVSRLHRNLRVRVEQLSGTSVTIRRQPVPEEEPLLDPWLANAAKAKTLVSIVSPSFVRSAGCGRLVEAFRSAAEHEGNLWLESGSRLFKVVKHPVPPGDVPSALAELFMSLLDYDLLEVEETERRGCDEERAWAAVQRYHERVYDLARDICRVLRIVGRGVESERELSPASGATIYLATTTPDVEARRDRLRRELLARGHWTLPDRPLPLVEAELEAAVDDALERCEFFVHVVGGQFGAVVEGGKESVLELQNRLVASHATRRRLPRLIWIAGGAEVGDPRQERWIGKLRTASGEPPEAEVIEGRFETVKALLLHRLAEQAEQARNPGRERPPRVYLICDRRDEEAVEEVEDFFFERGIEVALPPFEASDEDAPNIHLENLRTCDAALIYYGVAGEHWVASHLRELAKANGYRDSGPIPVQVVYLAPPFDPRKDGFKSRSVEVLRQGEHLETRALDHLAVRILEARVDG